MYVYINNVNYFNFITVIVETVFTQIKHFPKLSIQLLYTNDNSTTTLSLNLIGRISTNSSIYRDGIYKVYFHARKYSFRQMCFYFTYTLIDLRLNVYSLYGQD